MRRAEVPSGADRLRPIRALVRQRASRDRSGLHYVEGLRAVFRALDSGAGVETLVYCERLAPAVAQQRVRRAQRAGTAVLRVSAEEFRSLSSAAKASGIGAVVRQHWSELAGLDPRDGICWVAVSLVRTPGNLGTLLRTAEAAGAGGVILIGDTTDPFDPRVVAASRGGIFGVRLVRATPEEFAGWAERHGCSVVGTSPHGDVDYTRITLDAPTVLLFGEERRGLGAGELALCTQTARIAMSGAADSLNVAVAAAVVLFEVRRRTLQRQAESCRSVHHRRSAATPSITAAACRPSRAAARKETPPPGVMTP